MTKYERREKVYWLPEHFLTDILFAYGSHLQELPRHLCLPNLDFPDGFAVKRFYMDIHRRALGLVVSHPSFPVVADGSHIPDAEELMVIKEYMTLPLEAVSDRQDIEGLVQQFMELHERNPEWGLWGMLRAWFRKVEEITIRKMTVIRAPLENGAKVMIDRESMVTDISDAILGKSTWDPVPPGGVMEESGWCGACRNYASDGHVEICPRLKPKFSSVIATNLSVSQFNPFDHDSPKTPLE